jgi:hypothetical protein
MERGAHATAVPFLRRAVLLAPHDPAPLAWLILALARTAGPEAARRELEDLVGWNGLAREQSERLRALCEPR